MCQDKEIIAKRIKAIPPSPTLTITAKAKALRAAGEDVISLAAGEPDFDTPDHIKKAAIDAIHAGFTKYTEVGGIPELKEAVAQYIKMEYGLSYTLDEIMISCGGKQALYNLFQVILEPGDEVIIPAPYWVSYPPIVILAGGRPIIVKTREEDGFRLRAEDIKPYIGPKTKAIIINSPSNPTGSIYTKEDLLKIAELIIRYNIHIISDDVYHKIILDDIEWCCIASLGEEVKKRTFIINSVSKTYAMTGWRIGYLIGNKNVIKAATRVQSQSTSNPNSIAQKAALAALTGPQDFVRGLVEVFKKRRDLLMENLAKIPGVSCFRPQGTFYAFPRFSSYFNKKIKDSLKFTEYLLEEAKVAVVPGIAFGSDGFVRLSFATSLDTIEEGLFRIKKALDKL